jgi:hypothetical protein
MIDFNNVFLAFSSQIVISPDSQLLAFELRTGTTSDTPVTHVIRRDGSEVRGVYQGA